MNAADFVLEGVAKGVALLELLERYAPPQRDRAWHMEECFMDVRSYVEHLWWESTEGKRAQLGGDWADVFKQQRSWADRYLASNPTPTDHQMCYDDCLYPRARVLIDAMRGGVAQPSLPA